MEQRPRRSLGATPWAFFAAIILGALVGALGAFLRDEPVRIGPVVSLADAAERSFLDGVSHRIQPASPFASLTLVDLSTDTGRSSSSDRSPPVSGTDRRTIAATLDQLLRVEHPARLVVLDLDISPIANSPGADSSDEEASLLQTLSAWNRDPKAPPLLLVRGEGCGPPVSHAAATLPQRWAPTPYDTEVAPTSSQSTRIGWACALPVPSREGAARSFHAIGCASRQQDWTDRFPVPSPGEWARILAAADPGQTNLTSIYSIERATWAPYCLQETAGGATARPQPIVEAAAASQRLSTIKSIDLTPSSVAKLRDGLVVLGRFDLRAGDLWVGPTGDRIPGARLVAANIDTAARFRTGVALNTEWSAGLALGLGALLGAIYWTARSLRRPCLAWLGRHGAVGRFGRSIGRIALSAPALGLLMSSIATITIVAGAHLVAPASWPLLWYVSVGCGVALAVLDIALTEEKD